MVGNFVALPGLFSPHAAGVTCMVVSGLSLPKVTLSLHVPQEHCETLGSSWSPFAPAQLSPAGVVLGWVAQVPTARGEILRLPGSKVRECGIEHLQGDC